ncbi:cephalosporin hydroxylase family protein [Chloroflexota bacterium]
MSSYNDVPSLRKFVRTKKNKDVPELERAGSQWIKAVAENRLSYEIDWLGVPVIQTPEDLVLMQELIFRIKPDIIIETGIAHGGSLVYYASLMEILGKGKVVGIDIEIREHNRTVIESHPLYKRIELIEQSSTSKEAIREVRKRVQEGSNVIVCLDSDHTRTHVLSELNLYQQFVKLGGYIVVFDTIISELVKLGVDDKKYLDNSPREAIDEFLKENSNYQIDKQYNKLHVSTNPNGYLKRIK